MPPPDPPQPPGAAVPPDGAVPATNPPVLTAAAVLAATSGSQLEATLHDIVTAAVEHVDARYGAMGVLTPDGRRLDRFVIVGMDGEDGQRIGRLPTGHGILGLLVEQPIALRLDDLGEHPASIGFPAGHPPMRSFIGVPVRVRDSVFGNLYLTEKRTGGRFTPADVEVAQALAAVAGLAIENARLLERAERRRRWEQAATEMAAALLSGAAPDDVLRTVSERVSALAGADMAGVLLPSRDDDGSLTIVAAVGPLADEVEGVRLPVEGTQAGRAWREGAPLLVEDIASDPVDGARSAIAADLSLGYGPGMVVPLGSSPALGVLGVLRRAGREHFDGDDLELLSSFAIRAAPLLELANSQQRERRLQVQADRDRIARDLHDHVVQRIYATSLSLDRLGRAMADHCPREAAQLARSVDELDATIAEIRAAIFELHEQDGQPTGTLEQQLADIVRQATEGHPLRRDVRLRGAPGDLPRDLLPDLVAVVRELVANVVRHARAGRVSVTVAVGEQVQVVVSDDGVGLPALTRRSGLANLSDRAERRGGRLAATGGPGGTEVRWTVPLAGADRA